VDRLTFFATDMKSIAWPTATVIGLFMLRSELRVLCVPSRINPNVVQEVHARIRRARGGWREPKHLSPRRSSGPKCRGGYAPILSDASVFKTIDCHDRSFIRFAVVVGCGQLPAHGYSIALLDHDRGFLRLSAASALATRAFGGPPHVPPAGPACRARAAGSPR
jgi:hypothetical protein